LRDYRVYKYDSSSRLIKDLYINPENESGESLKTSEASGTYKMTFANDKLYSNISGLKTHSLVWKFDLKNFIQKEIKMINFH
jgi:hypothetical protein